ncbi:putative membrane protein [Peptoniphilus sp. ING2-D1G]|nr:putative membrane protein [Peptoniphilus sp. ING2-D1G]
MRNNVRGLVFHIFIIIILFLLNVLIGLSDTLSKFLYGNIIFKIILALIPVILYFNFSKAMNKRVSRRLDFLTGNLIILIALILFVPAFIMEGFGLFKLNVAESIWKFPLDLFLMPGLFSFELLGFEYSMVTLALSAVIPGMIYGISIRRSRIKINRRNKIMEMKKRR